MCDDAKYPPQSVRSGRQYALPSGTRLPLALAFCDESQVLDYLRPLLLLHTRARAWHRVRTMTTAPIIPQITPRELKARLDRDDDLFLLDVREPHEREICQIGGELIPKDSVAHNLDKLPRDKEIVVYCRSGGRSQWVAQALKALHGFNNVTNLAGGVLRWSDEVDSSVQKY